MTVVFANLERPWMPLFSVFGQSLLSHFEANPFLPNEEPCLISRRALKHPDIFTFLKSKPGDRRLVRTSIDILLHESYKLRYQLGYLKSVGAADKIFHSNYGSNRANGGKTSQP